MRLRVSVGASVLLCLSAFLLTQAQDIHKPVFVSRVPASIADARRIPIRFSVSAYDPDGDSLTFTWKVNASVVQSGKDSSYLLASSNGPFGTAYVVKCVFSDPGGLRDSTIWTLLYPLDMVTGERLSPDTDDLAQNYPNPFNPSTTILFRVRSFNHVTMTVFNIRGEQVAVLVDSRMTPGIHEIRWAPSLPSGTYFCRFAVGSTVQIRKLTLLK